MINVQASPVTFDEFMTLPNPVSGHLELHNGEVVLVPPGTQSHARVQQVLFVILHPLTKGKGFLNVEFPFRTTGNEMWQADLAFVVEERSDIPDLYLVGAPDWVIEVLSPSNTVGEMNQRINVCMTNGCGCFWVVDPKGRTVSITERKEKDDGYLTVHFVTSQSVPLPSPLEGRIPVAAIFI